MDDDKITTIISADYMYLVFLGDDDVMGKITDKLNSIEEKIEKELDIQKYNKSNKSNKIVRKHSKYIYVKTEIDSPCIDIVDDDNIQRILTNDAIKLINKQKGSINSNVINQEEIDANKKYIIIDEGVETAQCLTYADMSYSTGNRMHTSANIDRKRKLEKIMMLMIMIDSDTHYKLSYPILQLDEEENPAELIESWLKEHDLKDLVRELTISPVNIVGNEHDILVFSAVID